MAHATQSISIAKPVAEVFAFVADGMNNPKWRPAVTKIARVAGTVGSVGDRYEQQMSGGPFGQSIRGDYEVTESVPGKRLVFQVIAGPARPTGTFEFASVAEGTRLTFTLDFQPTGLAKLLNGMIQQTMNREVSLLENLKRVLEV